MQIVEFETMLKNGMISVPVEYRKILPEKTRLIVKIEPADKGSRIHRRTFNAVRYSTRGLKFNREEANAR